MIAIDTSVIVAIVLEEPEAETFKSLLRHDDIVIGWPTLFETRTVLAAKGFTNSGDIVARFAQAPNILPVPFDERHYRAAEDALDRYGRARHRASLNMGDCFSYAVSVVSKAPLLFKGRDFSKTDLKLHPASSTS